MKKTAALAAVIIAAAALCACGNKRALEKPEDDAAVENLSSSPHPIRKETKRVAAGAPRI
jgi:predicted small lipoprotein YifL